MIIEHENLEAFEREAHVAQHLIECSSCRARISYEKKLRSGFAAMSCEEPPAFVFQKIMDIQVVAQKQDRLGNFIRSIQELLFNNHLKVAFVSGLAGFILALVIIRPASVPLTNTTDMAKVSDAEKRLNIEQTQEATAVSLVKSEPAVMNSNTHEVAQGPDNSSELNNGIIPGALSFSLAEEEVVGSAQDNNEDPLPQLAMAPVMRRSSSPFPSAKNELFAKKAVASSDGPIRESLAEGEASHLETEEDILGRELLLLLQKHGFKPSHGFIDFDELLVRGYLSVLQIKRLRPLPNHGWFFDIKDGEAVLRLRKK